MCPPDTPDDAHDDEHTDVGIQEAHVEGITPTSAPRQFTGVKNDQEIRACPQPDEVDDERSHTRPHILPGLPKSPQQRATKAM